MIRSRVVTSLSSLASSLGEKAQGAEWHLFGSVDRDEQNAEDIDLMILCKSAYQADTLRQNIDPDALELPLHLSFMTYEEAEQIKASSLQGSTIIIS